MRWHRDYHNIILKCGIHTCTLNFQRGLTWWAPFSRISGCIRSFHLEVTGPFVFNVSLSCTKTSSRSPWPLWQKSTPQSTAKDNQPGMVSRTSDAWAQLHMALTSSEWGVGRNPWSSSCGCTFESPGELLNLETPRSHPTWLTSESLGWDPGVGIFLRAVGDYNVQPHLRTSGLADCFGVISGLEFHDSTCLGNLFQTFHRPEQHKHPNCFPS